MADKRAKSAKPAEKAESDGANPRLGQLRLLIALDALLVEGSVGGAAKQMGLSIPAMSRLLGQIRDHFDDPIFVRSGRAMIATPKAEALRGRLRRLANEADALMKPDAENAHVSACTGHHGWNRSAIVTPPPLTIRKVTDLENHPSAEYTAAQFADIQSENDPTRRLAKYIAVVGRKVGHTRPLELHEAEDAFTTIFAGEADPMQISALLRLIHYRGLTAPELAGMACASARFYAAGTSINTPALDWPAYLSPNSSQSPWFMLSALLVARAGYPVLMHGSCGVGELSGKLEIAAEAINMPIATSHELAESALRAHGICFMPMAGFAPQVQALLALYPLFESRSPVNSLVHLLNPLGLKSSFLGVSQPAYRELHRDAAVLLDMQSVSVVSTSRDVAELVPHRKHTIYRHVQGHSSALQLPTLSKASSDKHSSLSSFEYWHGVWSGTATDERAESIVIATAAMAMMTVSAADNNSYDAFHQKAAAMWRNRHSANTQVENR
ncbi:MULTISPECIES: glycosyl transferase family protein [Ochrobactrum]|uniref:Glycosyl transferase family protein n=1 Tax=Ochrobactrum teleogrylli TaxID=2479765 RepID=A0ABY2Y6P2_9HYPH|nr:MULTISPECIES: glycosyl transferase family protein [Brucella]MCI1001692.1 glycosyl transferase family protein [Ochrobactrum sp. C6C9]RLL64882.1 glycosyl transferase family protein [[Ochrobactrum] soli]TNV16736.1 glycosyl transferase family protein [[Ochrobactrum] teleogrylli]